MKETIIVASHSQVNSINWAKPQWFINTNRDKIVLSNGNHGGGVFSGICLPCSTWIDGNYSDAWDKSSFTPLTKDLTITIGN